MFQKVFHLKSITWQLTMVMFSSCIASRQAHAAETLLFVVQCCLCMDCSIHQLVGCCPDQMLPWHFCLPTKDTMFGWAMHVVIGSQEITHTWIQAANDKNAVAFGTFHGMRSEQLTCQQWSITFSRSIRDLRKSIISHIHRAQRRSLSWLRKNQNTTTKFFWWTHWHQSHSWSMHKVYLLNLLQNHSAKAR